MMKRLFGCRGQVPQGHTLMGTGRPRTRRVKAIAGRLAVSGLAVLTLYGCSSATPKAEPLPVEVARHNVKVISDWHRSVGGGDYDRHLQLSPANLEQALVTVGHDGNLAKVAIPDGKVIWQKNLNRKIIGGVGQGAGLVLVNGSEGNVYAIDAQTGQALWQSNVRSQVSSRPDAASGMVVVHTDNGHLLALDAKTGKENWALKLALPALTLHGTSSPVIVGDVVLVGQPNGRVAIADLSTGELLAERTVAKPHGRSELQRLVDIQADLLLEPNLLYAVSFQGKAAAIEAKSGRTLWQRELSSYRNMAKDYQAIYIADTSGVVWALNKSNGTTLWQQKALLNRQLSAPAVYGKHVLVADNTGMLFVLASDDGEVEAKYYLGSSGVSVQPIVQGDKVYIYDDAGVLHALSLRS